MRARWGSRGRGNREWWTGGSVAILLTTSVAAGCGGCANAYRIKLDAVRSDDRDPPGHAFYIESGHPTLRPGNIRFDRVAENVRTALSSKGFFETEDPAEAEMIVEIDFGLDGPFYSLVAAGPNPTTPDPDSPSRAMVEQDAGRLPPPPLTPPPTQVQVRVYKDYDKFLRISAREAHAAGGHKEPREIWSVIVRTRDESEDLEKYVPLLAAAAMDRMGQNLEHPVEVVLRESDERVTFVKAGM